MVVKDLDRADRNLLSFLLDRLVLLRSIIPKGFPPSLESSFLPLLPIKPSHPPCIPERDRITSS
jgi:hypothetical protein